MKTKQPRDNLHMNWRNVDGHNKAINGYISPREPGKTDTTWWTKIYSPWCEDGRPWAYFVRTSVEITDAAIMDIENNINKWAEEPIELHYKKGQFKDGIVDVYIKEKLFIRIYSLNIPLRRIKMAKLENIGGIFFDEYIIDPKSQEKYIPNEWFKIKEAYTTFRREYQGKGFLKMYITGNPYSLFNPAFIGLNVDVNNLKKDTWTRTDKIIHYKFNDGIEFDDYEYKCNPNTYVNDMCAIEWGTLHPILKRYLKEKNPLYMFDEEYNSYALEGNAVNDRHIKTGKLPNNYELNFVIRIEGKNVGIFKNNYADDLEDKYFCKFLDEVGARRTIYCFDFAEMVSRSVLMSLDDRCRLQRFKDAMRKSVVAFEDINVYYYCVEVFKNL
ncbi:phage DNA encapsidation protein [bacterium]|nr:phage DNA encapsidation protein [bacterium]